MAFPAMVILITVCGFFKALIAYLMGDDTAYQANYVTLNPLSFFDLSTLLLAGTLNGMLMYMRIGFRWMWLPFIPTDSLRYRIRPLGIILVSWATSLACALTGLGALYFLHFIYTSQVHSPFALAAVQIMQTLYNYALFFAVFHLIPLPPLEGGGVIELFAKRLPDAYEFLQEYGGVILFLLCFMPGICNIFFYGIQLGMIILHVLLSSCVV